jgi:hypothetical protein
VLAPEILSRAAQTDLYQHEIHRPISPANAGERRADLGRGQSPCGAPTRGAAAALSPPPPPPPPRSDHGARRGARPGDDDPLGHGVLGAR